MNLPARLATTFALLSLESVGGANATLPEIHRQVVILHGWMSDATFARVVALGQIAPGPNVMVVSMVGWQIAGLAGMGLVTLATVLPSSGLAVAIGRLAGRGDGGVVSLARAALAPVALGFMLASATVMTRAAWQGVATLVVVVAVGAVTLWTRWSPVRSIAVCAAAGVLVHRLGVVGGTGS